MKTARRLGLAGAMALALMACIGVSSAAASSKITTGQYPTNMVGETNGSGVWESGNWSFGCSGGNFTADIDSAAQGDTLRPSTSDYSCTSSVTATMNGCTFVLHPHEQTGEGTFAGGVSVGNAPGKTCSSGIRVTYPLLSCTWTVTPQTRVSGVTFQAVEGDPEEFDIAMDNVLFSTTSSCGSSTLTYTGTWRVSAYADVGGRNGSQVDTSIETGSTMFEAEEYPATIAGGTSNIEFDTSGTAVVSCDALLDGTLAGGGSTTLATDASYSDCNAKMNGIKDYPATVSMNNCQYGFLVDSRDTSTPFNGSMDLDCDGGAELQIEIVFSKTSACVLHIAPQSGFGGSEFSTVGWSGSGITASLHANGVVVTRTGAIACGAVNQTATLSSNVGLDGKNGSGQPIGLWVN